MSSAAVNPANASKWFCALAALLPPLAVAAVVARYHVQVPVQDQWDFVPLLDSSYRGWPALADLVAQHNEHRPLFPRLVFLALARASSWDIRWELAVNLVTAGVIYALLLRAAIRAQREAGREPSPIVWPALSLLVFSLAQWENWLWGWQLQIFLSVAAVVGGLLALGFGGAAYRAVAVAIACGSVATWSFTSGLVFWPIGLLCLLVADDAWPTRLRGAGSFALAGGANVAAYLHGWRLPLHPRPPLEALWHPIEVAEYVFNFIGSPLAEARYSVLAGAAGVVLLAYLLSRLRAGEALRRPSSRAWLAIAAYVLALAAFTAVGRVGLGTGQGLASRYATFGLPLWAAVFVLLLVTDAAPGSRDETGTACTRRRAHGALAILVLALATARSASSLDDCRGWYDWFEPARKALVGHRPVAILLRLHPLESLQRGVPIARARRWSCFLDVPSQGAAAP